MPAASPSSGSPSRLVRLLQRFGITLCILIALTYISLRLYTCYLTQRITTLFHDTEQIHMGALESSLQPFLARYRPVKWIPERPAPTKDCPYPKACEERNATLPDYAYDVSISPLHILNPSQHPGPLSHVLDLLMIQTPPSLRDPFSLRNYLGAVQISIRSGHVQSTSADIVVEGKTGWIGNFWWLSDLAPNPDLPSKTYLASGAFLTIFGDSRGSINHRLTSQATPEQFHAAQDFNPHCLSGLARCTTLADLNPSAFTYFHQHPEDNPGINP